MSDDYDVQVWEEVKIEEVTLNIQKALQSSAKW